MSPELRNFEVFSAGDWLAVLTAHIPNAGEHLVRYSGSFRNVSQGKRRNAQGEGEAPGTIAKRAWARLITQAYEADPLVCPRCSGAMRLIAFIDQPEVIEKILTHLGALARPSPQSPPLESMAA